MLNKTILMAGAIVAISGFSSAVYAVEETDINQTNVGAFAGESKAHDEEISSVVTSDEFTAADQSEYGSVHDIEPAAGSYDFEVPNTGLTEPVDVD